MARVTSGPRLLETPPGHKVNSFPFGADIPDSQKDPERWLCPELPAWPRGLRSRVCLILPPLRAPHGSRLI